MEIVWQHFCWNCSNLCFGLIYYQSYDWPVFWITKREQGSHVRLHFLISLGLLGVLADPWRPAADHTVSKPLMPINRISSRTWQNRQRCHHANGRPLNELPPSESNRLIVRSNHFHTRKCRNCDALQLEAAQRRTTRSPL